MTSDLFAALGSVQDNTYEVFDNKSGFFVHDPKRYSVINIR